MIYVMFGCFARAELVLCVRYAAVRVLLEVKRDQTRDAIRSLVSGTKACDPI